MSSTPDPGPATETKPSHSSQVSDHEFHVDRTRSIVGSALVHHESVDDALSLASVDRPPSVKDGMLPSRVYHPLSLPVLALLMPASILGVLARLGLEALATYDGQSIFPLAYVQAVGCLIMGFGIAIKEPIGRFYGPLYTALTTGFCGSLTTFSGWQLDVFNSWVNAGQYSRSGLRDAVDGIAKTVFTLSVSLASLSFGVHLATIVRPRFPAVPMASQSFRYSLTVLAVLSYAATFPAYFRLPTEYRHKATAALLFAYPGALTRYLLAIWLNPLAKTIPAGTFTANSIGTALLGLSHVLQNKPTPVSPNVCAMLQGFGDGYCGCLTTVSTFATEVMTLREWKAWCYAAVSWVTGQLLLLVIIGSSYWAGHVKKQPTCTFS